MLSTNQIKVLASFFPELKEKTAKEIEKDTGLSHEPAFRTLKSLVKIKALKEKKVGKTNVYDFLFTGDTFLVYTNFVTERIKSFKQKHSLLCKRLTEFVESVECSSAILFGSYAKGTERKDSDIDLLIVSDKNNIEKVARTFKTKYNISINPVTVKPEDFNNIKKDNPAFYADLIKFGIVLYGIDFFFREVYKNAKTAEMVY